MVSAYFLFVVFKLEIAVRAYLAVCANALDKRGRIVDGKAVVLGRVGNVEIFCGFNFIQITIAVGHCNGVFTLCGSYKVVAVI